MPCDALATGPVRGRQVTVAVADDDDAVRQAVVEVLTADDRFLVVSSAASGEELLQHVAEHAPDVVLLDVRMPGGGAEAARAITGTARHPRVVALSGRSDLATVNALLDAGACGYLAKGQLGPTLPDLLARCVAGERVLA